MANKPGEANFFPDVPVYPEMGTFMPVYGKFDLTTYIQGASDYEIMAFLVGKYNACLEAYGNITKLSTETITACKQLQDWINSWFTNLDVQEEINKKLDSMVADGSFGTLLHHTFDTQINQQTTNAVTDWLVKNVTPAGSAVAVDKSLSIEGAAADAKSTGTAINSISTLLFTGNGRVWNKSVSTEVHAFNGTATSEFKTDVISNIAAGTGEITGVSYELIKPFTLTKDTDYTVYAYCSAPINGTLRFNEGVDWEVSVKANLNCITGLNEIHFTANKNITVSHIAIENPDNLTFSMWITLDERKVKAQERQVQKAETQDFNYITNTLLFTGNGVVWNKAEPASGKEFTGTTTSEFKTDIIESFEAGTGTTTAVSYELAKPFTLTNETDYTAYLYCSAPINGVIHFNQENSWYISVGANLDCTTGLNEIHFTANKNITVSYIAIENPSSLKFSMWITLDERKAKAQERQVQKAETQDFNYITNTLLFTGNGVVWNKAEPASGKEFTGTTTSEFKTDIIESFEAGTGTTTAVSYELAKPFTLTNETDYTAYLYCSAPINGVIHFNQENSWYISVGANLDCTTGLNEIHFTANKNITVSYIAIENPSSLKFSMWITLDERKAKALQQSSSAVNGYDYDIIFWGDSLTAGAGGSGTNYPSVCSQILGKSYLNAGVGGENAYLIATRQGADNLIVFGNPNRTYAPAEMKTLLGKTIKPLAQGGESTVNPINIAGQKCRLSAVVSEYEPVSYTISGFNGTLVSETPVGFSGAYLSSNVTSIFMGQNGPQDFAQLSPVIDSMIARTNGKVVIIGLTSGTAAERNSLETNMLTKYGNKYFNAREMVSKYGMTVQNLTPTTADTAAIAEGSVPPSLKSDEVHLNADGYTALGKMLATKIQSLGYFDE